VLERQLPGGLVDEPALLARDLEREDVVRVVVDREALRRSRREVGVRLRGEAELCLQRPAELRERLPVQVQALEDDRRAVLELGEDSLDIRGAREGLRPPGEVLRVVGDVELRAGLCQPEAREAKPA
jgi:hypothetical protein